MNPRWRENDGGAEEEIFNVRIRQPRNPKYFKIAAAAAATATPPRSSFQSDFGRSGARLGGGSRALVSQSYL